MRYTNIIFIVFCLFFCCCKNIEKEITEAEVIEATAFFMDSIVNNAIHGDNYLVIPRYNADLTEKDFVNLGLDTVFTNEDISFMRKQYNILSKTELTQFISSKYTSKFNENEPILGQVSYLMDPPLFTLDKKHFIIYSRTFFWVKDVIKTDDLYFVFERKKDEWKLVGFIRRF
jgi:hypothetical protein